MLAQAAADAARKAAAAAESAAHRSQEIKDVLEPELEELGKDRRSLRRQNWIAIATLIVTTFTLGVLFYQGVILNNQAKTAQDQLKKTTDTTAFSIIQRLKDDIYEIQEIIAKPTGAFDLAQAQHCSPPDTFTSADAEAKFDRILAIEEVYYDAARRGLLTEATWRSSCSGTQDLIKENCLLTILWERTMSEWEKQESKQSGFMKSFVGCVFQE